MMNVLTVCAFQVASLEAALNQAQAKLAEHANGLTVRASRAEEERWRWQSEAEELRGLLASRDRDIGRLQSKQEVSSTACHAVCVTVAHTTVCCNTLLFRACLWQLKHPWRDTLKSLIVKA